MSPNEDDRVSLPGLHVVNFYTSHRINYLLRIWLYGINGEMAWTLSFEKSHMLPDD